MLLLIFLLILICNRCCTIYSSQKLVPHSTPPALPCGQASFCSGPGHWCRRHDPAFDCPLKNLEIKIVKLHPSIPNLSIIINRFFPNQHIPKLATLRSFFHRHNTHPHLLIPHHLLCGGVGAGSHHLLAEFSQPNEDPQPHMNDNKSTPGVEPRQPRPVDSLGHQMQRIVRGVRRHPVDPDDRPGAGRQSVNSALALQ